MMKRTLVSALVMAAVATFGLLAPASAGAAPGSLPDPNHMRPTVVASLTDLKLYPFAESMVAYPSGGFVVSVTTCNPACTRDFGNCGWCAPMAPGRRSVRGSTSRLAS